MIESLRHKIECDGGRLIETPNGLVINFPKGTEIESVFVKDVIEGYEYINKRDVSIVKIKLQKD